jgi:hypothetical protein
MQTSTETSLLLSIIGALVSVVGIMVWKKLNTIEEKVDQNAAMHHKCREELPQKFATKEELREHKAEFKDWKEGRGEIWEALNNHSHDEKGRVIR